MGNWICFDDTLEPSFKMSNGLTDVFIDYMLLAGSELAETESEKRLIAFLSERQQSFCGIGTVGFHIVEMPWDKKTFDTDKAFLLRTVARARELTTQESVWDKLRYRPNPENIEYALDGFIQSDLNKALTHYFDRGGALCLVVTRLCKAADFLTCCRLCDA